MLSLIYENVELFFSSIVDEHFDIVVPFISLTVSLIFKSGMGWDIFFGLDGSFVRPLQILHRVIDLPLTDYFV